MEDIFIVITFPESQFLMNLPDFELNCCLINDEAFLIEYGSSAYFVRKSWFDSNMPINNPEE